MIRLWEIGLGRRFVLHPKYELGLLIYSRTERILYPPDTWVVPV